MKISSKLKVPCRGFGIAGMVLGIIGLVYGFFVLIGIIGASGLVMGIIGLIFYFIAIVIILANV